MFYFYRSPWNNRGFTSGPYKARCFLFLFKSCKSSWVVYGKQVIAFGLLTPKHEKIQNNDVDSL